MNLITTKAPSRGIIDSHMLTTGKTEAFFDGKIDKETIVLKGINYTNATVTNEPFLAKIKIKTKLKQLNSYEREFNSEQNLINIKQEGIEKDCFASQKLNVVAEKIDFTEPQNLEIILKPKQPGKLQSDESSVVYSGKINANMTIGVGLCVNTNGVIQNKKNKLKITNATKIELFMKVVTGYNAINGILELDVNKVLENTRGQMYLLESELYDVLKMKHLMDIEKHTLGD